MGTFRLFLALSVVMNHGLTTFLGSRLLDAAGAVWIFFAISGFLVTIAIVKKYSFNEKSIYIFYFNRIIRLYPTYWIWLIVTIILYSILPHSFITRGFTVDNTFQSTGFWSLQVHFASIKTLAIAAVANITGFFADSLLSLGLDKTTGALTQDPKIVSKTWAMAFVIIGQFWTIGVELCFYIIAPYVVKRLYLITIIFILSISGLLERIFIATCEQFGLSAAFTCIKAPKLIWIFMIGSVL